MATTTVSLTAYSTPATTLSNPISVGELQLLGSPTITVDGTATVAGLFGLEEGLYVSFDASATATENGTALLAAYTTAKGLAGLTATNRATVLVPPGNYDLGANTITMDTQYVDIAGMTGNPRNVIISSSNATHLNQTVADVRVSGVWIRGPIADGGGAITNIYTDCIFGVSATTDSLSGNDTYPGTFIRCRFEKPGKSSNQATFSGVLAWCELDGADTVYLGDGAVVRNTISEVTINAASAVNAKVYLCALKAALGGNVTNDITTPNNVVDTAVAV